MKSSVIIKGNKYGFQIVLNPSLPFEELLQEVAAKFRESMKFFDSGGAVAISFEGRDLTPGEQNILVDTIVENSGLSIGYIIDGAEAVETQYARALQDVRQTQQDQTYQDQTYQDRTQPEFVEETADGEVEEPEPEHSGGITTQPLPEDLLEKDGQFYRGTLRSGQKIEVDGSLVVLGDINPGAQVVARGNIVILGCLKGSAYAGYPDDKSTFVAALMMEPMQIQIGSCIARSPDEKGKIKKAAKKKNNMKQMEARMAFVEDDNIFIETITRTLINEISIK